MKADVRRIQQAGENDQERDIMRWTRKAKRQYKRACLIAHTLKSAVVEAAPQILVRACLRV